MWPYLVFNVILDLIVHVALWTSELCFLLYSQVHYKVKVVPHIVLLGGVVFEGNILVFKL